MKKDMKENVNFRDEYIKMLLNLHKLNASIKAGRAFYNGQNSVYNNLGFQKKKILNNEKLAVFDNIIIDLEKLIRIMNEVLEDKRDV